MSAPVALFDIDQTMYDGFSYFYLLEAQVGEGLIAQGVLDAALASMQLYFSGKQEYETTVVKLIDIYAAGLAGKSAQKVRASTHAFYKRSDRFFDYIRPTVEALKGYDISIVTGEPQFVAEAVGDMFGINSHYSSRLEEKEGKFTGAVTNYLATRHEKHDAIKHLMRGHQGRKSFAFGDSEGDVEMLRAVEYPICLNPTKGLQAIALKEGWRTPALNDVTALVTGLRATPR